MDAKDAECLIRAEGLGKAFPGVVALDDVSFDLRRGEVHALMGENGAGKSTLMKILAGVYRKDSGRLWVQGEEVDFHTPAQAQVKGVGIVHQELHLAQHLTVAQNMYIGREAHRWGWLDEDRLNRDAAVLFEHLNVKLNPSAQVSGLTVAAQQMVEIAKALTFRSRVLIMDEPTAALNTREVDELFRVIRQLRDEGVGIVYISHKMDEIQRIADRLTVMRDGKTIATVAADTPMPQVVAMMVGREIKAHVKEVPDTSGNPVLLEVKGLSRGRAVQNASLTVRRGEIVGLAGLMGAGRTELARLVFGADRREAGEIWVDGQKIDIRSPKDAVQAGIGYLSEDRKMLGLATGMNVEANVTLASLHRFKRGAGWLHHKAMREHAHELVKKLRVKTPGLDQTVRLLSGGNQQKVVMAKWLLRDCQVLFIDEPTRGIDVGAKAEIHHLLNELAAQGRAIVVISSELPEVLLLSHRVVVMCEGRITGELPGDTATQEQIMALATQRTVLA